MKFRSLILTGTRLGNSTGNTFIADTDHGKAPAASWGGPAVALHWISNDSLEIRFDPAARTYRREQKVTGISALIQRKVCQRTGHSRWRHSQATELKEKGGANEVKS